MMTELPHPPLLAQVLEKSAQPPLSQLLQFTEETTLTTVPGADERTCEPVVEFCMS
jgi:hypothetical protein